MIHIICLYYTEVLTACKIKHVKMHINQMAMIGKDNIIALHDLRGILILGEDVLKKTLYVVFDDQSVQF